MPVTLVLNPPPPMTASHFELNSPPPMTASHLSYFLLLPSSLWRSHKSQACLKLRCSCCLPITFHLSILRHSFVLTICLSNYILGVSLINIETQVCLNPAHNQCLYKYLLRPNSVTKQDVSQN